MPLKTNTEKDSIMSSLIKFSLPNESEISVIQEYVKYATKTGHYRKMIASGGEGAIFLILLMAREYDIPPLAALNGGLSIIDGKVEMSSHMKVSKIRQGGHSLSISYTNDDSTCIIKGKRKDTGDDATVSYSLVDAKKAGLAHKQNWMKYPKEMLYARAVSRMCNILFSDVIGGVTYAPGEIQEVVDVDVRNAVNAHVIEEATLQRGETLPIEEIEEELHALFPPEEHDMFSAYVADISEKREQPAEIMMRAMIDRQEQVKKGFLKWKEELVIELKK